MKSLKQNKIQDLMSDLTPARHTLVTVSRGKAARRCINGI